MADLKSCFCGCICPWFLRLLATICILAGSLWFLHVAMHAAVITKESASCEYLADFKCVEGSGLLKELHKARTGEESLWHSDFGKATYELPDLKAGECEIADDGKAGILGGKTSPWPLLLEGFDLGWPLVITHSELTCNQGAINLTATPQPCYVEASKLSSKKRCGPFSNKEFGDEVGYIHGVAGGVLVFGILTCFIAQCCSSRCQGADRRDNLKTIIPTQMRETSREDDALSTKVNEELQPMLAGGSAPAPKKEGLAGLFGACCACGRRGQPSLPR